MLHEPVNVEDEVEKALQQIDESDAASAQVPPAVTIEYYETLAEQLRDRAQQLRQEHGEPD